MLNQPMSMSGSHFLRSMKCTQFLMLLFMSAFVLGQTLNNPRYFNQGQAQNAKHQLDQLINTPMDDGNIKCATVENFNSMYGPMAPMMNEEFEKYISEALRQAKNDRIASGPLQIPVIFHIIHDNEVIGAPGSKNIDGAFIMAQIDQANEDFAGLAPPGIGDDTGTPTNTQIQFIPALIDPMGNLLAEPGINRIDAATAGLPASPYTITDFENIVKPATQWNPDLYFNSWSSDISLGGGILLGYAQFPEAPTLPGIGTGNGAANTDGIFNAWWTHGSRTMQNPGALGIIPSAGYGRTWSHEAGHFFGLRHIWGDAPNDCTSDDFVADTPQQATNSSGCPLMQDSCPEPGVDNVENYMDYSSDLCMDNFTPGQVARMEVVMGCTAAMGSPRRESLASSPVGMADGFFITATNDPVTVCTPMDAVVNFDVTYMGTFMPPTPIALSIGGLPGGASAVFSTNPVIADGSYMVTIIGLPIGTHNLTIDGTDGAPMDPTTWSEAITVNVDGVVASAPTLMTPADAATDVLQPTLFSWSAVTNATNYLIEIDDDPGFGSVDLTATVSGTSYSGVGLMTNTTYYWRVIPSSSCGAGPTSSAFSFTTAVVNLCTAFDFGTFLTGTRPFCSFNSCTTPLVGPYETWSGEAWLLDVEDGVEYEFEFCTGYSPTTWSAPATITVAEFDFGTQTVGAIIDAVEGCAITFTATSTGNYIAVVSSLCGVSEQIDNGLPTFACTGNTAPTFPPCPDCPIGEDFEAGQPAGWTFDVTPPMTGVWMFDANPFGDALFPNPGSGNWAYYDDDLIVDFGAENHIASATSPAFDMTDYVSCSLEFAYSMQDIFSSGTLTLSINNGVDTYYWDGAAWTMTPTLWLDDTDEVGFFNQPLPPSFDNSNITVEFVYDDEQEWAWGFGFDEVRLCGTFMPLPPPIPTMGEWGLMILALLLMIVGARAMVTTRKTELG